MSGSDYGPSNFTNYTYYSGYNCWRCGQWVGMYQYHNCDAYVKTVPNNTQPGPYKCPDCGTWWVGYSHKCQTVTTSSTTFKFGDFTVPVSDVKWSYNIT
jgi:predicted RNA-binding Zn-ribbon protein involved in translation (DUF1610 family)